MTPKSGPKSTLEWVLFYISIGWWVFPLKTEKGKAIKEPHAMTMEGKSKNEGGHNAATNDPAVARAWWKRSPNSGIGINCRKSGIVVVDIDPRHGGDKTLARLRREHPGVLDSPIEALTGGGGTHLIFLPEKGARYPGNLGPVSGIDIKDNGYICVAPSPHEFEGKFYAWLDGKSPADDNTDLLMRLDAALMNDIRETERNGAAKKRVRQDDTIEAEDDDIFAEYDDRPLAHTEEQIRAIVFSIPNEGHREDDPEDYVKSGARSYDDWFAVLCGIYHQTAGSEEGKQIALEWSQQASAHTSEKFEKSWRSADSENKGFRPKTFRSVIQMANKATKEERELKYEAILEAMINADSLDALKVAAEKAKTLPLDNSLQRKTLMAQYQAAGKRIAGTTVITAAEARQELAYRDPLLTNAPDWCSSICFVAGENMFVDWRDARRSWTKIAFDNTFMRAAMTEEDIRSGSSRPTHAPSDLALTRYGVRVVDARGYLPWDKNWRTDPFYEFEGRRFVNTYTAEFAVAAKKTSKLDFDDKVAIEVFEKYGRTIFPVERDWWLLKSWLKYVILTKQRVGWSPVLYSVEGMGKTLLFELVTAMLGSNNVSLITGLQLQEKYNTWAESRLLALVEEVGGFDRKERFDTLNAIKPIITNARISVRDMRKTAYEVMNTVNILMTTNKADFFDLNRDGGDTRLWLPRPGFESREELEDFKAANPEFYPEVVDALTHHIAALKRHLLTEPYHPEFIPGGRAPPSEMKKALIDAAKTDIQLLIEDALKEGHTDVSSDLLRIDRLIDVCGDLDATTPLPTDRWLAAELQRLGFHRLGRARVDGVKQPMSMFWSRRPKLFKGALATSVKAYIAENDTL